MDVVDRRKCLLLPRVVVMTDIYFVLTERVGTLYGGA